ncbi:MULTISPECIES: YggT family protein [Allobacillus]|uniref:YggT family protein n=1 Tax=Allobacillus halotolerans TaxID=570278 RepID=A0ABS6GSI6_9BACI|nr:MULTISPECIES: YggT family protein [Allobacillus]MBU6081367.1 YggT family protein [Allobacillus halotolerans]TSJ69298.1 YggT family protein [Allobacillus sp. SKP2-8]
MLFEVFKLLSTALSIYSWALIIYILMSWFPGARESGVGEFLGKITEPYLEPFRKIIPPIGMLDISPIVAIIALQLASNGLWVLYGMLA